MRIETISYIKQHAAKLELEEPIVVTQGGKAVYRIESEASARLRDEGIALLKLMNLAERDIRDGHTLTLDESLQQLRQTLRGASE
ncbi:type II toxin-antitoxin system Phd/YefM family antitoxin [Alkalimonas delamerensis]|uniref:Type II toxin-antitoxin system Phd/YefM family antitoxin n=1 Tax=Alkalimonas delamerensis TaxID=265981 RepID=A0ABT9GQQ8_9GAMM|nr:type II toxin-antitoxin system Phd/YefM family antitoxin [Alkalimonas delamerensis]MDP4529120.1 type II toxin-antitoxin system Phd/YefM family antitoxin [Alkalimonas delamerensis]